MPGPPTSSGSRSAALGAHTVDVTTTDPVAVLRDVAGRLADVVVDVTAAAPEAFDQALALARPGGTVVVAGTRGTAALERFNPDRLVFKELRLLGARGVDGAAYAEALHLLADDDRLTRLPARVVSPDPDDVAGLLDDMAHAVDRPVRAVLVPGAAANPT